jgi:hypothetical protein
LENLIEEAGVPRADRNEDVIRTDRQGMRHDG